MFKPMVKRNHSKRSAYIDFQTPKLACPGMSRTSTGHLVEDALDSFTVNAKNSSAKFLCTDKNVIKEAETTFSSSKCFLFASNKGMYGRFIKVTSECTWKALKFLRISCKATSKLF